MNPPIIADDDGDVLFFESVESAERYIEPIDVRDKALLIFDSEGRLLQASSVKVSRFRQRVVLSAVDDTPQHEAELRATIVRFLSRVGQPADVLEASPLAELIERMSAFKVD